MNWELCTELEWCGRSGGGGNGGGGGGGGGRGGGAGSIWGGVGVNSYICYTPIRNSSPKLGGHLRNCLKQNYIWIMICTKWVCYDII